ncbi:MAG: MerR family transcriptional regulator [Lachnospiraceae bacterium]|nr:MerR family transcriptional regulator [Lachnospiraceae bacterium]
MEKKKKLLTIGHFAALHGINKKTLMWYDEIGLFHPSFIHPENGYRYYSYYQSAILETILLLRELDVPIDEIKAFMKNRSAASMKQLLQEKIDDLDRSMAHLKAVRKTLSYHCQNMQTLLTMDLSEISIVQKKERSFVTVDINQDTTFDKQVEMITAETKKYQLRRLHDASYGTMIAVDRLQSGNFEDYSKLFIEIPFPIKKDGLHIQPAGDYVRAFYRDATGSPVLCYQKIFEYVKEHGLALSGFSYEVIINENVIDRVEDALVQIEIPVKSK